MSSELKTNKISPATGTALTLADSGDTLTLPSGATLAVASGATLTNSGTATGFGKVLQTVSASYATTETTTSTSYVDTSLSATITPASSSNKILIWVSSAWFSSHGTNPAADARIYNSTDAASLAETHLEAYTGGLGSVYQGIVCSIVAEDTGRSVATTYKLQHKATSAGRESRMHHANIKGWIILMEVEA